MLTYLHIIWVCAVYADACINRISMCNARFELLHIHKHYSVPYNNMQRDTAPVTSREMLHGVKLFSALAAYLH